MKDSEKIKLPNPDSEVRNTGAGEKGDKKPVTGNKTRMENAAPGPEKRSEDIALTHDFYQRSVRVGIIREYPDVILPAYAHNGGACMDLRAYAVESYVNENGISLPVKGKDFEYITLHRGCVVKFDTGIRLDIPKGWSVDMMVRSGLSCNHGIILMNGKAEIDCTYRGKLIVALGLIGGKPYTFVKNERIAQFKAVPNIYMELEEIANFEEDSKNQRGESGLGSSGKK